MKQKKILTFKKDKNRSNESDESNGSKKSNKALTW